MHLRGAHENRYGARRSLPLLLLVLLLMMMMMMMMLLMLWPAD